ncbi:MAG: hypothetical protein O7D91_18645 [Planctomycetota bacterium]|nr:hypothetical protein [Planctomycetota bacterium]
MAYVVEEALGLGLVGGGAAFVALVVAQRGFGISLLDVVFANRDHRKKRYTPLHAAPTIHRQFRKIANQAGLKVDLKMIRKGGYSAAIEGGCDPTHAEILMGHAVKISNVSDHYLERNPKMVADACAVIEAHYFNNEE